jgi:hypothetical protein
MSASKRFNPMHETLGQRVAGFGMEAAVRLLSVVGLGYAEVRRYGEVRRTMEVAMLPVIGAAALSQIQPAGAVEAIPEQAA